MIPSLSLGRGTLTKRRIPKPKAKIKSFLVL